MYPLQLRLGSELCVGSSMDVVRFELLRGSARDVIYGKKSSHGGISASFTSTSHPRRYHDASITPKSAKTSTPYSQIDTASSAAPIPSALFGYSHSDVAPSEKLSMNNKAFAPGRRGRSMWISLCKVESRSSFPEVHGGIGRDCGEFRHGFT